MDNPGYIALSRQVVLRHQMDLIANNLANLTTPSFKAESMLFAEQPTPTHRQERLSFVLDLAVFRDLTEGPMTATGNPLDLAISGPGYFAVDSAGGRRYTRQGGFRLDSEGQIVTHGGDRLLDERGAAIQIPPETETIDVANDGTVSADRSAIARIAVVEFNNEQSLRKTEAGLYVAEEEPLPAQDAAIMHGMLEQSNVKGVVEITKLIATSRSYQSAVRLADEEHERQRRAIQALISV